MVSFRKDGGVQMADGRVLYGDCPLTLQDFVDLNKVPWFNRAFSFPNWGGGGGGGVGGVGTGVGGGATGAQGAQGTSGAQGAQGPSGGLTNDIFAAARVVDPAGAGTDLTIQSAIAAIAASLQPGGDIYIKPGVYNVAATLVLPDGKSVVIRGAGKGATVINLPTADVPLFEESALATGTYFFRDFTAVGDGASTQAFLNILGDADNVVQDVDVTNFRHIVDVGGDAEVAFRGCSFTMPAITACSFWFGAPDLGELTWLNVEATLPTVTTEAISGSPVWHVTDSYIGGPAGQSAYLLGVVVWQGFNLDKADVRISREGSRIVNLFASDVTLKIRGSKATITNSLFSNLTTTADHIRLNEFASVGYTDIIIAGCVFDGGALAIRAISATVVEGFVVQGCTFKGFTSESILVSNSRGTVIGCRFPTPGVAISEDTLSSVRYSDCQGLRGSSINGVTSVVDQDNFRNVMTWGATGDGVTDDTGAIQSAIDALPPDGGVVFFPPGHFRTSTTLVLPNKPVFIRGSGASNVLFGTTNGSVIDIGVNAIAAFTAPAASVNQEFIFQNLFFLGSNLPGQVIFSDTIGCAVTLEQVQITGWESIFEALAVMTAVILKSIAFTVNSLMTGAGSLGSVLTAINDILFLDGPVGIFGNPILDFTNVKINSFGAFIMGVGNLSTINQSRLVGGTIHVTGGECRISGSAIESGLLDLNSDDNVVHGCLFENTAIGVLIQGQHNTVGLTRFKAVAVPINEVSAADFNLFDAINGYAGSIVIGANSVTGTVIP